MSEEHIRDKTLKLIQKRYFFARQCLASAKSQPDNGEYWLREAIRAAYYSLFQFISLYTVDHVFENNDIEETRWLAVFRGITHHDVKSKLNELNSVSEIKELSNIFTQLQDLRSLADYDPRPFHKSYDEIANIFVAMNAAISNLKFLNPSTIQKLYFSLIIKNWDNPLIIKKSDKNK